MSPALSGPPVDVHILCGALGVGKTTALRHLLRQRPEYESWALLINEWGAVGIDGAALQDDANTVMVREIAGGCICCSQGPQLRLALDRLLARQPRRILIEPSGLASPTRLVDLLRSPDFASRVRLGAVITLVDPARFLHRHEQDEVYAEQLQLADILLVNKSEGCSATERASLSTAIAELYPPKQHSALIEQGALDIAWLDLPGASGASLPAFTRNPPLHPGPIRWVQRGREPASTRPLQRESSRGGTTASCGWIASAEQRFSLAQVGAFFDALAPWAETHGARLLRAKGVLRCGDSWWLFSWVDGQLSREVVGWRRDSRWEILLSLAEAEAPEPDWAVLEALLPGAPA